MGQWRDQISFLQHRSNFKITVQTSNTAINSLKPMAVAREKEFVHFNFLKILSSNLLKLIV